METIPEFKRYRVDNNYNTIIDTHSNNRYSNFYWFEDLGTIAQTMNDQENEIKQLKEEILRLKNIIAEF